MPATNSLPEAVNAILDAVVARLEAEQTEQGRLADIREIVRGDRARPRPDTPSLWVFPDTARNSHTTRGLAETWNMPVAIVAVVDTTDPREGYRNAQNYASIAGSVVLDKQNRRLGLNYVNDVQSLMFHPSSPWDPSKDTIFAAAYVVEIHFTVYEGG